MEGRGVVNSTGYSTYTATETSLSDVAVARGAASPPNYSLPTAAGGVRAAPTSSPLT
jgi:hypothetical protein